MTELMICSLKEEDVVKYEVKDHQMGNGTQVLFEFVNGYGASIIRHEFSYGSEDGRWELAVLKDDDLCYDTPITDNVIGYLTEDEVIPILAQIAALDPVIHKQLENKQ